MSEDRAIYHCDSKNLCSHFEKSQSIQTFMLFGLVILLLRTCTRLDTELPRRKKKPQAGRYSKHRKIELPKCSMAKG